ncbi:MAG: hypothetical protein COC24_003825 [Alphaproteobacteria bacterium]|nr:hypothetical protein [Alphaproteobacteria bacterium]
MSEDDKKNEDVKPEDEVVETIEVETIEAEEVEAEDVSFEELDRELDEIAPPIAKEDSGFGGLIVAALLGGVATVVLVFGLGYFTLKSDSLGGLSHLINGGDAAAAAEERYTDVSTRILSIEGELIEIQETMPEPTDLSPIIDKIAALEGLAAQQTEQSFDFNAELDGIRERLSSVVLPSVSVNSAGVANEAARVVDLEKIADIEVEIAALTAELAAVKSVAENAAELAAAKNTGLAGDASGMATALAVASLERALQDEAPFEVELNALKGVAGDNVALAELAAYAATGLASEVTLLGQFNGLLDAALVADLKGEGKSIFDKFIGNAKAVISIRKTGNVEGDNVEAVLARMEVAILNKNLSAAIAEGEGLEGPAKTVFANWMAAVKSRMAAQDLMRQVSADILTSLQ